MTAIDISTKYPPVRNYIGGAFVDTEKINHLDVTNPADGSVISRVPLSPATEVDRAVQAAKRAFPMWSALPIKELPSRCTTGIRCTRRQETKHQWAAVELEFCGTKR